jgi:cell division protease FtsH
MPSDPNPTPPSRSPSDKSRRRQNPGVNGSWIWLVLVLIVIYLAVSTLPSTGRKLDYGDFIQLLNNGALKRVVLVGAERIDGELRDDVRKALKDEGKTAKESKDGKEPAKDLPAILEKIPEDLRKKLNSFEGKFTTLRLRGFDDQMLNKYLDEAVTRQRGTANPFEYTQDPEQLAWLQTVLPTLVTFGLLGMILFLFVLPRFRDPLGGSFLSNYIKSPAKRYERSKLRVTFDDVAGMQNAKGELQEVVEFLRTPEKFQRLGAVVPKGVLLVGPPGTGKTLLARAVAGEAGVPFYSISGSEFIQMFVGVGASRVRDMFKTAKENAPCILFIDEIDAVGRMRGAGLGGGSDEREQTLNQILSEMDGFTPTETVIVMAATNRPDVLDSALLRPGRFDRHITVDRPTWQGRLAILKVHTRNKPLADNVDLESIARGMIGMTGADLRNLANEAALVATRENKSKIDRADFERAADRVLIGAKREEVLSAEEKRRTAYHEAGHTVCAWLTPGADPLFKVTIVPRGQAGGVTRFSPEEDRVDYSQTRLKAQLIVAMGGRAADRLIHGEAMSGAIGDLKQATRIARMMVTQFGMSDKVGPVAYRVGEEHVFLGKEIQEPRDFSEGTATLIDEEVRRILREADDHAYNLLETHRNLMEALVEALMQKEELLREEIDEILKLAGGSNGVVPARDNSKGITALIDNG